MGLSWSQEDGVLPEIQLMGTHAFLLLRIMDLRGISVMMDTKTALGVDYPEKLRA
tara:strand:+ start:163961 stop:164125 length:165 start_codon:yes stop_codon:yes gene_type:complete